MIIYNLICGKNHIFEGWFKNSETMNEQLKKGGIACPACNNRNIKVKPSFATKITGNNEKNSVEPQKDKANLLQFYKTVQNIIEKNFEDVGPKFADQALMMHWEDIEKKNIRGTTTKEEEKELYEAKVPFIKLKLPKFDA